MTEESTTGAATTDSGATTTTDASTGQPDTSTGAGATPPADTSTTTARETEPTPATGEDTSKLQRALESERSARKEAEKRAKSAGDEAAARATEAESKYQETLDKIAGALGFKNDEAPPDPTALQRTIAERDNELGDVKSQLEKLTADKDAALRERDVELAAWRAASKQGANVPALLDSRTFVRGIANLDPASESFPTALDEAVKAAIAENPSLRATPPVTGPNEAGIGSAGSRNAAASATPGAGRLRAAYSNS